MNKILSNIMKGLLVALVLVVVTGVISINMKMSSGTSLVLVSSSLVNSINTNDFTEKKDEVNNKIENKEEKTQENIENLEDKVEEVTENKEESKEETKPIQEDPVKEVVETPVIKEETPQVAKTPEPEPTPSVANPNGNYNPNNDVTSNSGVTATYTGLVTAYGPDCYGCYGSMTAMGDYVGEGNIYYNHPTYGTIRIVAGDKTILNKVVRITGLNISSEPVIAIVRDTGGDIGFNKPKGIILDLLYTSERSPEVLNFGMQQATVEVLN